MWSPVEVVGPCAGDGDGDGDGGGAGGAGEAPCARGKHAAALLGSCVYVLGGRGAGGAVPLRDCWRYHIPSGRWERLRARGEAPPALQEHSATPHSHRLYVFGGEAAPSAETPLWVLHTETLTWRKLPGVGAAAAAAAASAGGKRRGRSARGEGGGGGGAPGGRRGHSAHALNDCLLIYGGYRDLRGSTNELWAFHYETESWQQVRTANAGPARHRHAAALAAEGTRLYVHGGRCDLRACADLWVYDTLARLWAPLRTPPRLSPSPRSGHTGIRAGGYFYIFGGEVDGNPTNELWRFHFATETWERMEQGLQWPAPRVDACALLLAGQAARVRVRSAPCQRGSGANGVSGANATNGTNGTGREPAGLLREISKLSSFHLRRSTRCAYSVLGEKDSNESLARDSALALAKSRSAYVIDGRAPNAPNGRESPRAGDVPDSLQLSRDPSSVPDFAECARPEPSLSPVAATRLVYFDSEEEEEIRISETAAGAGGMGRVAANVTIPKSASVRFRRGAGGAGGADAGASVTVTTEEEGELSTSDYASAERVNRLSGFSNPHYLGPDVRALGARARAALTPDSGVGPGDIELQDMRRPEREPQPPPQPQRAVSLLLLGGREAAHPAHMASPLAMWTYRLL